MDYFHEDPYCTVCNASQDPSITGIYKRSAFCRYYQTGNCRRGSNCPFVHVSTTGQVEIPAMSPAAYQGEHMYNYHPLGPTAAYHPLDSQAYPVFLWQPYPPLSSSFDPRYGFARQAEIFPDYPDDKSDPSSIESSSTVASIDYQLRIAHDKARLEGVESTAIQGASSPPGVGPDSSRYAVYGYPVLPEVKAKHVAGRSRATSVRTAAALPSSLLSPCQKELRKKPLAYKTKPCKFYAANGKCISGEKCTFIHDQTSKGIPDNTCAKLSPPMDAKLPPKPLSKYEECRSRDYYPITWRVIGGGVMMGGHRQICPAFAAGHCKYGDDCKLAHETELETDPVGFVEPKNEPVQEGSPQQPNKNAKRNRQSSQKPKNIKVSPPSPHPDGCAPDGAEAAKKACDVVARSTEDAPTSSSVHRRTRSLSMVLTSPSPLDTAPSSYAEL